MFEKVEWEEMSIIVNRLVGEFSIKFKAITKEDVLSECYIFYYNFHKNYEIKYNNYQLKDKEYKESHPITDWKRMFRLSYERYCRKQLYRVFTKQELPVKMTLRDYEDFLKQERNKNERFIKEDRHDNFGDITLPKLLDYTYDDEEFDINDKFVDNSAEELCNLNILLSEIKSILSEKQYKVFYMYTVEKGNNFQDIASKLGITREAVRQSYNRAIANIRKELQCQNN